MKRLLVLRHAKSSWDDASLADFDRPLNERGRAAAPFMGRLMAREKITADIIISSPAQRARDTAGLVREAAGLDAEIRFDERVYEASPHTLARILTELEETYKAPMIVGHNPGMEGLIRLLTGTLEPMPTAALAVVKIDAGTWADVGPATGTVEKVYRPKAEMHREAHR